MCSVCVLCAVCVYVVVCVYVCVVVVVCVCVCSNIAHDNQQDQQQYHPVGHIFHPDLNHTDKREGSAAQ